MCLRTSMSNGMSKDIQGQVFKALWHVQGSLGCSCFYTGEEPLRDAKWDLGISRNPLCLLHPYKVCCRADSKQQRSLNYTHSHQFYNKKFLFPSCCLQPHMVCCGNSPVTKLGGWPALHAKDDAYSKCRNFCFRGRKIHCWCHKLYPSIVNNFCPSS